MTVNKIDIFYLINNNLNDLSGNLNDVSGNINNQINDISGNINTFQEIEMICGIK